MIEVNGPHIIDTAINNEEWVLSLEMIVQHLVDSSGRISQADHGRYQKEAEKIVRKKYSIGN